jgi:CheY-like chemotaxis protein
MSLAWCDTQFAAGWFHRRDSRRECTCGFKRPACVISAGFRRNTNRSQGSVMSNGSVSEGRTRPRLLPVEDEAAIRWMAKIFLEINGYHVIEATNGSEAMALRRENAECFEGIAVPPRPFRRLPTTGASAKSDKRCAYELLISLGPNPLRTHSVTPGKSGCCRRAANRERDLNHRIADEWTGQPGSNPF